MSKKQPKAKSEDVSAEDMLLLQMELEETKRKYGIEDEPKKEGRISRAISAFFDRRDAREKQLVSKKKYMLLMLLGAFGAHRFYARQYPMALFYLATCWLGISVAMTVIDVLAAIPMQPDENGNILI